MARETKYMHILDTSIYMGSMGPLYYSFITQHAFFSALGVQCVLFTLRDSPIRTVTYSELYIYISFDRWVLTSTTESFLPLAATCTSFSGHFFYLVFETKK